MHKTNERNIKNFIGSLILTGYKNKQNKQIIKMCIIYGVLLLLSFTIISVGYDIIAISLLAVGSILAIISLLMYKQRQEQKLFLIEAITHLSIAFTASATGLGVVTWWDPEELHVLVMNIIIWMLTVLMTYIAVIIMLRKNYYYKERGFNDEKYFFYGVGVFLIFLLFLLGPIMYGITALRTVLPAISVSIATKCMMRYYYVKKYGLEGAIRIKK
ncbi:MAG: hypothetical protein ACOX4R_09270 [Lentihominibacter sp.]|jgi:hypothetical protein